jgi:acetoin utilization protein AcuB
MNHEGPTVADYMTQGAIVARFHEKASRARGLMREYGVRHLLVLRDGKLVGLVSDRDLADVQSVRPGGPFVEEAMTRKPYVVAPDALLHEVARAMAKRKYGSAVVMDDRGIAGVFTTTDALKALADALEGKIATPSTKSAAAKPSGSPGRAKSVLGQLRGRVARRAG